MRRGALPQAFSRWREEHAATAAAVHSALAAPTLDQGSLRALVDEARSQLWGLFQARPSPRRLRAATALSLRSTRLLSGHLLRVNPYVASARRKWRLYAAGRVGAQLKRAVVYGPGAALVAGGAHLPPHERPFSWMATGPPRPSDAAGSLLARLSLQPSSQSAKQLLILKVHFLILLPTALHRACAHACAV